MKFFNINHDVTVKLTASGKVILGAYNTLQILKYEKLKSLSPEDFCLKMDEQGCITAPLYEIVAIFGHHITTGLEPFNFNFQLDEKGLHDE